MRPSERHEVSQTRLIWPPSPGYFRVRLVKDGWLAPAEIRHNDDDTWQAIIDGRPEMPNANPVLAAQVAFLWTSGLRIDEAHYRYLVALAAWARTHAADHPAADPRRPIKVMNLRPIKPRTPS